MSHIRKSIFVNEFQNQEGFFIQYLLSFHNMIAIIFHYYNLDWNILVINVFLVQV